MMANGIVILKCIARRHGVSFWVLSSRQCCFISRDFSLTNTLRRDTAVYMCGNQYKHACSYKLTATRKIRQNATLLFLEASAG